MSSGLKTWTITFCPITLTNFLIKIPLDFEECFFSERTYLPDKRPVILIHINKGQVVLLLPMIARESVLKITSLNIISRWYSQRWPVVGVQNIKPPMFNLRNPTCRQEPTRGNARGPATITLMMFIITLVNFIIILILIQNSLWSWFEKTWDWSKGLDSTCGRSCSWSHLH